MKFKLLAGAIVAVILGLVIWWFIAARAQEAAMEAWFADRRAAGWQAEAADISVIGFPNRLDMTLTEPAFSDPESGWAWSAPRFDIAQVIYDPTFFVAFWPQEQRIAAPGARATLRTEVMEASLRTEKHTDLALLRVSLDIQRAALVADAGWTAGADRLSAHLRAAPEAGPENAYEMRAEALRLRLPDHIRSVLDPAGALPPAIENVVIETRAALDRPLDRHALEGPKPNIAQFSLKTLNAEWGALRLAVSGAAKADADGYADGEFDIEATNWKAMLDAAVEAGALDRTLAETLKTGLGFVARFSGSKDTLNVPLIFSGGLARIGPVPVGRAPRLTR